MFVVFACGDTLVDDTYRGGSWSARPIQPAPEINAAELTCRFQEVDYPERCSEDFAGFSEIQLMMTNSRGVLIAVMSSLKSAKRPMPWRISPTFILEAMRFSA